MSYRKKRILPAPNKNDAKVFRRESTSQSGIRLEMLNPAADRISLQLEFYDSRGNLLDQRSQSFGPNDRIDLQINCMGSCGNGKIDLEGKIKGMLDARDTVSDGKAKCLQTLYAGSSDICGHELRCRISINYKSA